MGPDGVAGGVAGGWPGAGGIAGAGRVAGWAPGAATIAVTASRVRKSPRLMVRLTIVGWTAGALAGPQNLPIIRRGAPYLLPDAPMRVRRQPVSFAPLRHLALAPLSPCAFEPLSPWEAP